MDTCAECRFWKESHGRPSERWRECHRVTEFYVEAGESEFRIDEEGALLATNEGTLITRGDFGCVQFEHQPMPETMTVIQAGPGERVEPLPGHIMHAPYWDGTVTAVKVSINGQWFEIRPRG